MRSLSSEPERCEDAQPNRTEHEMGVIPERILTHPKENGPDCLTKILAMRFFTAKESLYWSIEMKQWGGELKIHLCALTNCLTENIRYDDSFRQKELTYWDTKVEPWGGEFKFNLCTLTQRIARPLREISETFWWSRSRNHVLERILILCKYD
jgi:hypothetical protein